MPRLSVPQRNLFQILLDQLAINGHTPKRVCPGCRMAEVEAKTPVNHLKTFPVAVPGRLGHVSFGDGGTPVMVHLCDDCKMVVETRRSTEMLHLAALDMAVIGEPGKLLVTHAGSTLPELYPHYYDPADIEATSGLVIAWRKSQRPPDE